MTDRSYRLEDVPAADTTVLSAIAEMGNSAKPSLQAVIKERVPKELHVRQIIALGGAAGEII
jgi:hypothetical protein